MNQNLIYNFTQVNTNLNRQKIDIHKEKHQYLLWQIQQIQTGPIQVPIVDVAGVGNNSIFMKKQLIEKLIEDLDNSISQIDFELDEMKEQ